MNTSWWLSQDDLDPTQREFVLLPPEGRLMLQGPPGSGKTNLLLLRAQYLAARGDTNVLVLTYTNALADFMRKGIEAKGILAGEQVRTFHSWASSHIREYLDVKLIADGDEFDDKDRTRAVELLLEANQHVAGSRLFHAIFVDEAQDLTVDELEALLCLSDKICVCGDIRQGIWQQNGLDIGAKLGLDEYVLEKHYRIGQRIAQVADKLMSPALGIPSLEQSSNYNAKVHGTPTAEMLSCASRDAQFERMLVELRVQVLAFQGDHIGILCAKRDTALEVYNRFQGTEFEDDVDLYNGKGTGFGDGKTIHIITLHSAKGTEFRAVHLFATEEMRWHPFNRTKLAYTAVTRAKTALRAYRTGATSPKLEGAFAQPQHIELNELFPET